MNLSYLKSPGNIPKEEVVKIVFVSIALIIIIAMFSPSPSATHMVSPISYGDAGTAPAAMAPQMAVGNSVSFGRMAKMTVASDAYDSAEGGDASTIYPPMPVPTPGNAGSPDFPKDRKIIRNGNLSLVVNDVDAAASNISQIAKNADGWIDSQNIAEYREGMKSGSVTIRVPGEKFETVMQSLKLLAVRVENENVSSNDVSAEYVDLEAQLRNFKAEEVQYQDILKRSGKISEVLEVTRALSEVRGNIERTQGQLNFLSRQVSMSSITISLTPVADAAQVTNDWKPVLVVKEAWKTLLANTTGLIDGTIIFVIAFLPVLLVKLALLAIFLWVIWKIGKVLFGKLSATLPSQRP